MPTDLHASSPWIFLALALVTLLGSIGAIALRNLVHCGLCLAVVLAALAALYLQLNAQFLGLAQALIYIGAVAVLILFTVLLTRGQEPQGSAIFSNGWLVGAVTAVAMFGLLTAAILASRSNAPATPAADITVRQIGESLMGRYVLPLQVAGLLLTAALIGAVVIALPRQLFKNTARGSEPLQPLPRS